MKPFNLKLLLLRVAIVVGVLWAVAMALSFVAGAKLQRATDEPPAASTGTAGK